MGKKIILHVVSSFPTKDKPYKGIFIKNHVACSCFNNKTIAFYFGSSSGIDSKELLVEGFCVEGRKIKFVTVSRVFSYFWRIRSFVSLCLFCINRKDKIRVIHAHTVFWAGIFSMVIGKALRIPVVISEHSSGYACDSYTNTQKLLLRIALINVSAILPVTHNLGAYISKYSGNTPHFQIDNCVDSYLFKHQKSRIGNRIDLLYVGNLEKIKNVGLLLQAISILKHEYDLKLRIVGGGNEKNSLIELVKHLDIFDVVSFIGVLDRDGVRSEMRSCNLLCLTSMWESQPCVIIEAFMVGRPVVAPSLGGIPHMVNKDNGALFQSKSLSGITAAMKKVFDQLDKYDSIEISNIAIKTYSFTKVSEDLNKVYRKLEDKDA